MRALATMSEYLKSMSMNVYIEYFLVVCFIECQHSHTHEDDLVLLDLV